MSCFNYLTFAIDRQLDCVHKQLDAFDIFVQVNLSAIVKYVHYFTIVLHFLLDTTCKIK